MAGRERFRTSPGEDVNARIAREEAPVAFTGRRGFPNL